MLIRNRYRHYRHYGQDESASAGDATSYVDSSGASVLTDSSGGGSLTTYNPLTGDAFGIGGNSTQPSYPGSPVPDNTTPFLPAPASGAPTYAPPTGYPPPPPPPSGYTYAAGAPPAGYAPPPGAPPPPPGAYYAPAQSTSIWSSLANVFGSSLSKGLSPAPVAAGIGIGTILLLAGLGVGAYIVLAPKKAAPAAATAGYRTRRKRRG